MPVRGRVGKVGALLAGSFALISAAKPTPGNWVFDIAAMDRGVKPGDDFNAYAGLTGQATARLPEWQ